MVDPFAGIGEEARRILTAHRVRHLDGRNQQRRVDASVGFRRVDIQFGQVTATAGNGRKRRQEI